MEYEVILRTVFAYTKSHGKRQGRREAIQKIYIHRLISRVMGNGYACIYDKPLYT